MMTSRELFEQIQLSEASYSLFQNLPRGDADALRARLLLANKRNFNGEFSLSQATDFVSKWGVSEHQSNTASGFSATLFANKVSSTEVVLAIRGTEVSLVDGKDLSADIGDIALDGLALHQIMDLYNYWQYLSSPKGLAYEAARFVDFNPLQHVLTDAIVDLPRGRMMTIERGLSTNIFAGTDFAFALGAVSAATKITVTGHSLGGHLAAAFTRLFPLINADAVLANGAGFVTANANVDKMFRLLNGAAAFDAGRIINVFANRGPEIVAQDWYLQQGGGRHPVFSETAIGYTFGHGVGQITDGLAVYDLFIRLSSQIRNAAPASALATLKPLFEASSAQAESSLERVVDALVNLFGLDFPPLTEGRIGDREALYERIVLLQTLMSGVSINNPGAHVDVLTTANAESLALLASGSEALAYRYALKALNPFAIVGDNTLYAIHNDQGQLDLYNFATRSGTLTESWLTERSKLLEAVLLRNTQDNPDIAVIPEVNDREFEYRYYENSQERVLFAQAADRTPGALPTEMIQFGDDTSRKLLGSDNVLGDRIFGGKGADFIEGRGGQDYLEGGRGMDVYTYNTTQRVSLFGDAVNGDGADTVLDVDGNGVIRVVKTTSNTFGQITNVESWIAVDASVKLNETTWRSADGRFNYVKAGEDLVVVINGDGGGTIILKNWREGDFGIRLLEGNRTAPLINGDPILGDRQYQDFNLATPELDIQFDTIGNIMVTDEVVDDVPDTLYGNRPTGAVSPDTPGQHIIAGGGNDSIFSDRPNGDPDNGFGDADHIDAGAGRDRVEAGAGNDWVIGGVDGEAFLAGYGMAVGGDVIDGGAGADALFGNAAVTLAAAIQAATTGTAVNAIGDFISGGAGNDWVISGAGRNTLLGGEGDDIVIGGAGNDNLLGDDNRTAQTLFWNVERQIIPNPSGGNTYQLQFSGTAGVAAADGGRDALYGGKGEDWIFAGGGDDFVDGGAERDVIFGNGGADVIIGGNGNDVLIGDSGGGVDVALQGGDVLDGGEGNDELQGDDGDDVLMGGVGVDTLRGGEGNDILIGGKGNDIIIRGPGKDIFVYNRGDGEDVWVPVDGSANHRGILVFGDGISRSDVKFRLGSLLVDLGASNPEDPLAGYDRVHVEGFSSSDPFSTPVIEEIRFADGEVMSYEDILNAGFDLDGSTEDDIIDGTGVTDRINSFAGNDDIAALDGDDVIDAGDGDDIVDAGAGNDIVEGGLGNDEIQAFAGNDTVNAGDGDDIVAGGDGDDVIDGGAGHDQLTGDRGDDQMQGGGGDDQLDGGAGNDVLSGGAGNDAYLIYGGMGSDVVVDSETWETSVLQLAGGMSLDNLAATQAGDSLRISLRGLDDSLLIEDYYSRPQDWLIRDADGNDAAMADLLTRPDPAGDFVNGLWDDLRQGQVARIAGQAQGIGWQSAGGFVFNTIQDQAYIEGVDQTTIETITQASEPFGVLAVNNTRLAQEVVQGFGVTDGQNFKWFQWSFETGRQESDAALIMGTGGLRTQTQVGLEAMLTLKRDGRAFNFQRDQYSEGGAVISYDTGTEVVLAAVTYEYDNQSYNRLASVSQISTSLLDQTPNVLYGNRVRVDATQFTDHFRYIEEIIAGASANRIQVTAGNPSYLFQSIALVDGGAGNDTITGQGAGHLLYGNSGDDVISASASLLIGGDGNDQLIGQGGSRFIYTATETGIDQVSENSIYIDSYLDWYYRGQGISNWQVRAEHAGEYEAAVEGDGFSYQYFSTYEAAAAQYPEATITFIEALPELPIVLRNDKAALNSLAAAGVLAQDSVLFGPGITLDDLTLTVAANDELQGYADQPLSGGGVLSVRWGDAGFDVAVPDLQFGFTGAIDSYHLGQGVDVFEFSDGARYTLDELLNQAAVHYVFVDGRLYQTGTQDGDFLFGDFNNDVLIGRGGDDFISGGEGDDALSGGDGDDALIGGEGNDELDGGAGFDSYSGDAGADRYHFGSGSGRDELEADSEDLIVAAESLTPGDVAVSRFGMNLSISVRGSSDQIEIYDWFDNPDARIAGLVFSDGTLIDANALEAMAETLQSTADDDRIGGSNGDDVIDGLAGNDEIYGNAGDDVVAGGEGEDWMDGGSGIDILRGGAGYDQLRSEDGAGVLDGGAEGDDIYDEFGSQFIAGGQGDDYVTVYGEGSIVAFNPGDGADTIYAVEAFTLSIGGGIGVADLAFSADGNDLILTVGANDSIRLTREFEDDPQAWPAITLQLFGSAHLYDLTAAIAAFYDTQAADPELLSFALADTLPALEIASSESSGLGGQLAQHYQQHGHLDGLTDAQIHAIVGAADFGFALQPLTSGLTLIGTEAADTLAGGPGNDFIDGLAGVDRMLGGEGDDSYTVDQAGDKVIELPDQGNDVVNSSVPYTLSAEVENLVLTGTANLNGTGNALANTITGNSGANRLDGKAGADVLAGGPENDVYVIDNNDDFIIELADEGTDTVQSLFDFTLAEHFENLTLTGAAVAGTGNAAVNRLTGNALDNVLSGLDGNDVLNGAAGVDILIGGAGNDTYVVDHSGDQVIEFAGEGVDTVQATTSYGLAGEIENLTLTGTAAIDGTGNALDNRLTGNAAANTLIALDGDDRLDGKAGDDLLVGGAGNDTYYVDQSDDAVLELAGEGADLVNSSATFTLSAEVENLTLTGTAAIDGSGNAGANVLTGNAADNRLEGLAGDDVLDGKAGADTLAGGAGNDRFVVDHAADITIEMADEGIDTVQAALSWTLDEHIEQLTLTGAVLIDGTGNAADNVLTGNNAANILSGLDGNDWLDGKGGSDTLIGGAGDDTHVVAQSGDVVIELAGEGVDTVRAGITWTLGEELENLVLTGTAGIRGTGNALANILTGNSGNNQLDGRGGADVMGGGAGNDTYIADDAGDQVIESAGEGVDWVKAAVSYTLPDEVENLTLTGTAAIDGTGNTLGNVITGNAATNTLTGDAGNDALNGGAGADLLVGGTGDDFYTVDNAGDVVIELADEGIDTVNTSMTHTLADHVENLALTGNGNRNATGNALDNIIAGNRGINILNGMAGNDTLAGGLGNDSYRFDLNFGHDVIAEDDATAGNVDRIFFGAGIAATDVALGRLDDDLVAHTADKQHSIRVLDWFAAEKHRIERIDFADGASWDMAVIESQAMQVVDMPGLQRGNDSASTLLGRIGNTILEGNGGGDVLTDGDGNNLYSGGSGDDIATGGDGNDLFAGGAGNDTVYTGAGSNVIAYNAGGGVDAVYAGAGAQNTLSLGGGLGYSGLALSRDSNDLVLNAGAEDKVVLKDWYAGNNNLLNLQVILDAGDEFDAGAADPLYNRRVQNFDFLGMVNAFDAAQAANPGLSLWALGDALTQYHLSGADDAALGGDLAYWYARNGGFTGIGVASAQQIIGAPGFGAEAQGLREFSGLQEGLVRLG